jgi:Mg-chelatase subunit ChlD
MTTSTILGMVLHGTNADLAKLPSDKGDEDDKDKEGGGEGSDDKSDEGGDDGDEDGSGDDEDGDEDGEGSGSKSGKDGKKGKKGKKGKGKKGDKSDDDADEDADGSSGGGEPSDKDGEGKDGKDGEDGDGDADGEPNTDDSSSPHKGGGSDPGKNRAIAQSLLDAIKAGQKNGLKDNNSALGDAVDAKKTAEDKSCKKDEQVWRPSNPDGDTISYVRATESGKASAAQMREEVRGPTSALRARMRAKFLLARRPNVVHGVRQGQDLSERRLVDSCIEMRSGKRPSRPDWKRNEATAVTLAAAVAIDQSGSMDGALCVAAAKGALVVADALDRLGSPCLVVGPRDGYGGYGYGSSNNVPTSKHAFHRHGPINLDIFKDWHEGMENVWPRFGHVQATGGTPLEDGIQYALQELNGRTERYRVVFVMTDGCPNNSAVCRRQIRLAAESGVFVIGVGIGNVPEVARLFPLHIQVPDIEQLPNALMAVLEIIIFPKRGQQVILDGRVSAKFNPNP